MEFIAFVLFSFFLITLEQGLLPIFKDLYDLCAELRSHLIIKAKERLQKRCDLSVGKLIYAAYHPFGKFLNYLGIRCHLQPSDEMKDAEHVVSLADQVAYFVKHLLYYRYRVQLESRELIEDQAQVLNDISLLFPRFEMLPLKLLTEKGAKVPVGLEETFLKRKSRLDYNVAEGHIQVNNERHPVLEGVDQADFLQERWLLNPLSQLDQCILSKVHIVIRTIALRFQFGKMSRQQENVLAIEVLDAREHFLMEFLV